MDFFHLYDDVVDKVTGKEVVIVYISDQLMGDCYLVEPIDYSYEPDWREADQLKKIEK